MPRVCVVGSLNIDVTMRVERLPAPGETLAASGLRRAPGGKGANQALAAARAGAETVLLGRVGDDAAGAEYLAGLAKRGVDCGGVVATAGMSSGHAFICVDAAGENTIVVAAGANGAVNQSDVDSWASVIAASDVLLLQFELPPEVVTRAARLAHDAGVTVAVNPSPFAKPGHALLEATDVLVVNEGEASALGDTGVSTVVTRGARGARWDGIAVPAAPADVVDTTGAGDAFAGALAARLADRAPRRAALAAAAEAGASCVTHAGAQGWFFG